MSYLEFDGLPVVRYEREASFTAIDLEGDVHEIEVEAEYWPFCTHHDDAPKWVPGLKRLICEGYVVRRLAPGFYALRASKIATGLLTGRVTTAISFDPLAP